MSHAIAASFETKVRCLNAKGSLAHDVLLHLYSPAPASTGIVSLEQLKYYADFASDPVVVNEATKRQVDEAIRLHGHGYVYSILRENKHHPWRTRRQFDYRLTDDEKARLQEHGIMVSERLGDKSFADVYYHLYTSDLPVFVTSDSILHAWHRSFDAFLADLEVQELMSLLESTLVSALSACAIEYDVATATGNTAAQVAIGEVELYVATAHRLLTKDKIAVAQAPKPLRGDRWRQYCEPLLRPTDVNGNDGKLRRYREQCVREYEAEVACEAPVERATPVHVASNTNRLSGLVATVKQEQFASARILGFDRDVDFSLFKPRGHYAKTKELERYFRAMTWLGTIDFRIGGDEQSKEQHLFQLQCACMVVHVLRQASVMDQIQTILETISSLAGDGVGADNMTPMQLSEVIGDHDILTTFFGANAGANLRSLQDEIANRKLGMQAINAHPLIANLRDTPTRPPTAFGILGQQFVWSSFVFSKLVFDQVFENGEKVPRRIPSGMDVAFALFGNDAAASIIAERMAASPTDEDFVTFRDGLPYTTNLLATRQVVDEALDKVDPATSSVALLWQLALRELSQPSANPAALFKSETWQKRVMNTQLASFTQLRHDTILYAKQASTIILGCEYPAGYVDPYPKFWRKMHELAMRTLTIVETLKLTNAQAVGDEHDPFVQRKAESCFEAFANATQNLFEIATAQAHKQELSDDQVGFLKTIMEQGRGSGGSRYEGWYPRLFYTDREDSGKADRLVVDVLTDQPSLEQGDPGGILHMGVGDVNLAMVVVDEAVYAGPVFSHYEIVTPINERLTDDEFSARLSQLRAPQWASKSFLVTPRATNPK